MCESLIETGTDVRLATIGNPPSHRVPTYQKHFQTGLGPRRLGNSPEMRRWLAEEAAGGRADIIHNHSLWMMPNVYPGWVCRRHHCRQVVSPRGTLSAWALGISAIRKRIFWTVMQRPALREVACFHATADQEYRSIRAMGFHQAVCIVPNGIDVPELLKPTRTQRRQLLFVGRIHPVKGVDVLLRAWGAVQSRFLDWDLIIVGPDDGHLAEMRALEASLRLERVVFGGPMYGAEKLAAYRDASLFVLPTHSENFGVSVAEALAAGTAAVVTKAAPWQGLEAERAGWWVDRGVDPLVSCLEEALASSPDRLNEMGVAGRNWMLRDFSWRKIGEQTLGAYRWLTEGGDPPAYVRVN